MTVGVVVLLARGTPAELRSEEQVAHAQRGHGRLQLLAVELGRIAGVRIGADIDQELDPLGRKQMREALEGVV